MEVSHLDHLVLTVRNIEETVKFYQAALGMEKITFADSRVALAFGNQKINLHPLGKEFEPKAGKACAGSADLCFILSTSIDKAQQHLTACGVEIIAGPVQRNGANGVITSLYFRDPDQNLIEVSNYTDRDQTVIHSRCVTVETHKTLVKKFYRVLWDEHNREAVPSVLHEDFTFRGSLGKTKTGHSGFAEYVDLVHTALGDYHCNIEELVEQDEKVFAKMTFTGIHQNTFMGFAPTHKQLSWTGCALFTFRGERIADLWVLGDLNGLQQQLQKNTM